MKLPDPTQEELDAVLADLQPEPRERVERREAARAKLAKWQDYNQVLLGKGLTWVLPGTPGASYPWP